MSVLEKIVRSKCLQVNYYLIIQGPLLIISQLPCQNLREFQTGCWHVSSLDLEGKLIIFRLLVKATASWRVSGFQVYFSLQPVYRIDVLKWSHGSAKYKISRHKFLNAPRHFYTYSYISVPWKLQRHERAFHNRRKVWTWNGGNKIKTVWSEAKRKCLVWQCFYDFVSHGSSWI